MGKLFIMLLAIFWDLIVVVIPVLAAAAFFSGLYYLRRYLIAQNAFIEKYRASFDIFMWITGILMALGYLDYLKTAT